MVFERHTPHYAMSQAGKRKRKRRGLQLLTRENRIRISKMGIEARRRKALALKLPPSPSGGT